MITSSRYLLTFVLLFLSSSCLKDKLSNHNEKSVIDCGPVPANAHYIKLLDAQGEPLVQEELEIFSLDENFASLPTDQMITAKGCVLKEAGKTVFVRNKAKTIGGIIGPDFNEIHKKLVAIANPFSNLQLGCDSLIYNDGDRFFLRFENIQGSLEGTSLRISLALIGADTEQVLHKWPVQNLEKIIEYPLDALQLTESATYTLRSNLSDPFSGSQAVFKCQLRIDHNKIEVALAGDLLGKARLFDKEFTITPLNYTANFLANQDIDVEYCYRKIEQIDFDRGILNLQDCGTTLIKGRGEHAGLQNGLWQIKFRGKRGHIASEWKTQLLVVEKICEGRYTNLWQLKKDGCTKLVGELLLGPLDLRYDDDYVQTYLHSVVGDISLNGFFSERQLTGLSNLNAVDGHVTFFISDAVFGSFKSLEYVTGDLIFDSIHTFSDSSFEGFSRLRRIGGILRMKDCRPKDLRGFESLEEIDGFEFASYDESQTPLHLSDFPKLSIIRRDIVIGNEKMGAGDFLFENFTLKRFGGSLKLKKSRIKSLKGLEWIKSLDTLSIEQCNDLQNLDGLAGLRDIKSFIIEDNEALKDIAKATSQLRARFASIVGNPTIPQVLGFQQAPGSGIIRILRNETLKTISFGEIKESTIFISDNKNLEEIDAMSLRLGGFCLSGSPLLQGFPKLPADHKLVYRTTACG